MGDQDLTKTYRIQQQTHAQSSSSHQNPFLRSVPHSPQERTDWPPEQHRPSYTLYDVLYVYHHLLTREKAEAAVFNSTLLISRLLLLPGWLRSWLGLTLQFLQVWVTRSWHLCHLNFVLTCTIIMLSHGTLWSRWEVLEGFRCKVLSCRCNSISAAGWFRKKHGLTRQK